MCLGQGGRRDDATTEGLQRENQPQGHHTLSQLQMGLWMGKTELGTGARGGKRFGGMPFGSHFSGMLRGDYLGLNLF